MKRHLFFLVILLFSYLSTGCDFFLQDPNQVIYRPASIKIEDSSGHLLSQLPLYDKLKSPGKPGVSSPSMDVDALWDKSPAEAGLTEPFSNQEIPYLGGDNCLNSLFFDLLEIPYSNDEEPAYRPKDFFMELSGYVKEPANYFFFRNYLFLKESTYPFLNKSHQSIVGDKILTEGVNQALDQFYDTQLKEYQKVFNGKSDSFKIICQYRLQTMGNNKEEVLLHLFETDKSFIFLADKTLHLATRKRDSTLRFVSRFMMSKAFFREGLHFKPN
jgi:hypothetical protein